MSTPPIDRILVAFRARVDKNLNSLCWPGSSSSESYGYKVKKAADPQEKKMLKKVDPYF